MTDAKDMLYLLEEPPVATIVLHRPSKRNAFTYEMWERLPQLLLEAEKNPALRVIGLRSSESEAFSAGADISEFKIRRLHPADVEHYDAVTAKAGAALANAELPTIAMISGYCMGGGCDIAVACDIRLCDTHAQFGVTPARLGVVYPAGAMKRLVDLVGIGTAKYLVFSGQMIGASEAERTGLVS